MIGWVVDNDVLSKGTCYGFLDTLIQAVGAPAEAGVLGQAKFVLPKKIRKKNPAMGAEAALENLRASLTKLQDIEPTPHEISLAAQLEFEATQRKVDFDSGESLLAAVMLTRGLQRLFTGDKRAVEALQALILANIAGIVNLKHKTVCLEQGVRRMIHQSSLTLREVRTVVCANRLADTALWICFSCASPEVAESDAGLNSYIAHLLHQAPDVLEPG